MAKPRDSKFNKPYSTVDRLPKGKQFEDWDRDKEYRNCGHCGGANQEHSEHLRLYQGEFSCRDCRERIRLETSSNRAGRV